MNIEMEMNLESSRFNALTAVFENFDFSGIECSKEFKTLKMSGQGRVVIAIS